MRVLSIYEERKKLGLCVYNGCKQQPKENKVLCEQHNEWQRVRSYSRYREKIKNKICISCDKPAVKGLQCEDHKKQRHIKQKAALRRRKALGLCVQCTEHKQSKPEPGRLSCKYHLEKDKRKKKARNKGE